MPFEETRENGLVEPMNRRKFIVDLPVATKTCLLRYFLTYLALTSILLIGLSVSRRLQEAGRER